MIETRRVNIYDAHKPAIDLDDGTEIMPKEGVWYIAKGEHYLQVQRLSNGKYSIMRVVRVP